MTLLSQATFVTFARLTWFSWTDSFYGPTGYLQNAISLGLFVIPLSIAGGYLLVRGSAARASSPGTNGVLSSDPAGADPWLVPRPARALGGTVLIAILLAGVPELAAVGLLTNLDQRGFLLVELIVPTAALGGLIAAAAVAMFITRNFYLPLAQGAIAGACSVYTDSNHVSGVWPAITVGFIAGAAGTCLFAFCPRLRRHDPCGLFPFVSLPACIGILASAWTMDDGSIEASQQLLVLVASAGAAVLLGALVAFAVSSREARKSRQADGSC
jgi:hypothetical protein